MHKIRQSGGFVGRLSGPLLKTGLLLTRHILKSLAKSVLIPLRLTASASATDAAIYKKIFGSGHPSDLALFTIVLVISNEEMNDIMKIVKYIEDLFYL